MKLQDKITRSLDLPSEISGAYKIIITPNHIEIENYMGIIEYENDFLKINLDDKVVNIDGNKLEILEMTDDNIQIKGEIKNICF